MSIESVLSIEFIHVTDFIFLGSKITADGDCSHEIQREDWKQSYDKPRQHIKKQRHHFPDKDLHSRSYGFSSSRVQMWELDHKEGWAPQNWSLWSVVLSPWTARKSNQSILKEINSEYSLEGLMLVLKLPTLRPHDAKSQLIGKDPDAGKDWRREEKGMTDDEMVGWHHWLKGCDFEQAPGDNEGQGSLVCCSPRGCKELDTTERQNMSIESVIMKGLSHLTATH